MQFWRLLEQEWPINHVKRSLNMAISDSLYFSMVDLKTNMIIDQCNCLYCIPIQSKLMLIPCCQTRGLMTFLSYGREQSTLICKKRNCFAVHFGGIRNHLFYQQHRSLLKYVKVLRLQKTKAFLEDNESMNKDLGLWCNSETFRNVSMTKK